MRHSKAHRKFGRVRKVRTGLLKSLAVSLIRDGKIKTTEAKAKELRPMVEKMITKGKSSSLVSLRSLTSEVGGLTASKISKQISPKYKDRNGGYTRITKLPARLSDGSLMAVIELV